MSSAVEPSSVASKLGENNHHSNLPSGGYNPLDSRTQEFIPFEQPISDPLPAPGPKVSKYGVVRTETEFSTERIAAPWLSPETARMKNPNTKFHNEIVEFVHMIEPSQQDLASRQKSLNLMREAVTMGATNITVDAVGAFAAGIYLPHSESVVVVSSPNTDSIELMKFTSRCLLKHPSVFKNLRVATIANQPVIKLHIDGIPFDIHFNKDELVKEGQEMIRSLKENHELKFLLMPLYLFLKQRDLSNEAQGGVSLFLLHCMLVTALRFLRKRIRETRGQKDVDNVLLSEYYLKILEFYGLHFDCAKQRILTGADQEIVEKESKDNMFSLVCPAVSSKDIGLPAYRVKEVFNCLKNRYFFLTNYNFLPGESILKYLLNPCKFNFKSYLR